MSATLKHSGRPTELTRLLVNQIADWYDAVKALGPRKRYVDNAAAEWQAKRRALGYGKQVMAKHNLSVYQLVHAKHRRYKRCK